MNPAHFIIGFTWKTLEFSHGYHDNPYFLIIFSMPTIVFLPGAQDNA